MSANKRDRILQSLPVEGLIAEKEWKIASLPLSLSEHHHQLLEKLGPALHSFLQSSNLLYRQSVNGKQPAWIHQWLDAGKPAELIAFSRNSAFKNDLPRVIRPDLVLTENGFALTEIDSLPGGIGLTAWLQQTYHELGDSVLGGGDGMKNAFRRLFPSGHVLLAEEGSDYLPEFEWLVGKENVRSAETYRFDGTPVYRFVEAFDWSSLNGLRESWTPGQWMTPPLKHFLEEKLWLALFWMKPLQSFWLRQLGEKTIRFLENLIPYSWVVTPEPLPPHAVLPELNIQQWSQVGSFSQKDRSLVLKVSGFSPLAWGSRGVWIGSDLPSSEWQRQIDLALTEFPVSPRILQRFTKGTLIRQDWITPDGSLQTLEGRTRICPYYFILDEKPILAGALSTLCPSDKKVLHGMKDAILSPLHLPAKPQEL